VPGDRANVVKPDDNLRPEGEFLRRSPEKWAPGEKASVVKRDDNLRPEGDFEKRPDGTWAFKTRRRISQTP